MLQRSSFWRSRLSIVHIGELSPKPHVVWLYITSPWPLLQQVKSFERMAAARLSIFDYAHRTLSNALVIPKCSLQLMLNFPRFRLCKKHPKSINVVYRKSQTGMQLDRNDYKRIIDIWGFINLILSPFHRLKLFENCITWPDVLTARDAVVKQQTCFTILGYA